MRTHAQIIEDAGGPHALARKLGEALSVDPRTLESRVRGWNLRPASIPGEYWPLLASMDVASLDELAVGAAHRKNIPLSAIAASDEHDCNVMAPVGSVTLATEGALQ